MLRKTPEGKVLQLHQRSQRLAIDTNSPLYASINPYVIQTMCLHFS